MSGQRYIGENDCDNPQTVCPRADMPTGVGYNLCTAVCRQTAHSEVNALRAAGNDARGAILYLEGHTYACDPCKAACAAAGIREIVVGPPPNELIASTGNVAHCLNAGAMGRIDYETETMIAHALRGEGFDAGEDGTGRGTPLVPVHAIQAGALRENPESGPDGVGVQADLAYTLEARAEVQAIAFDCKASGLSAVQKIRRSTRRQNEPAPTSWAVRRLVPEECEFLQGFPRGYTDIPWRGKGNAPDGPRYKALGNSMAVNVMRWIGRRIQMVQEIGAHQ